jgi:hypothetical protein
LYGCSFNSFVALHANVLRTSVSCTSFLRDFLGEVLSLAPLSSNVSSASSLFPICLLA